MNKRFLLALTCSFSLAYAEIDTSKQTVDHAKQQAYAYMDHLTGWCSHMKGGVLIDLIFKNKPAIVVEIGVYGGKSLVPMGCALKALGEGKAYGIDPWSTEASLEEMNNDSSKAFWSWVDHAGIMKGLMAKIDEFELGNHIELIQATSEEASPIPNIDILHIDGNHSEKTSYFDVTKWAPLVKSGGWIILDDMTWYENGVFTTAKAAEWLNTHCIKFAEFTDGSVWGIWKKP
jgi:predicted O-methyltransferase YrrM